MRAEFQTTLLSEFEIVFRIQRWSRNSTPTAILNPHDKYPPQLSLHYKGKKIVNFHIRS